MGAQEIKTGRDDKIKSNQNMWRWSNQIKSNQIKTGEDDQIKSNQIKIGGDDGQSDPPLPVEAASTFSKATNKSWGELADFPAMSFVFVSWNTNQLIS